MHEHAVQAGHAQTRSKLFNRQKQAVLFYVWTLEASVFFFLASARVPVSSRCINRLRIMCRNILLFSEKICVYCYLEFLFNFQGKIRLYLLCHNPFMLHFNTVVSQYKAVVKF